MYRNMMKTVEDSEKAVNQRFDVSSAEMTSLMNMSKIDSFKAISIAFTYGYVLGQRALKSENKRTQTKQANERRKR